MHLNVKESKKNLFKYFKYFYFLKLNKMNFQKKLIFVYPRFFLKTTYLLQFTSSNNLNFSHV